MVKNVLTWAIIVIVLGLAVYGGYSMLTSSPQHQQKGSQISAQEKFELSRKCAADGEEFVRKYEETGGSGSATIWRDPQYHFNSKLNTCLTYIGFVIQIDNPTSLQYNQVIDIYSNKTLIVSNTIRKCGEKPGSCTEEVDYKLEPSSLSAQVFLTRMNEMMSE